MKVFPLCQNFRRKKPTQDKMRRSFRDQHQRLENNSQSRSLGYALIVGIYRSFISSNYYYQPALYNLSRRLKWIGNGVRIDVHAPAKKVTRRTAGKKPQRTRWVDLLASWKHPYFHQQELLMKKRFPSSKPIVRIKLIVLQKYTQCFDFFEDVGDAEFKKAICSQVLLGVSSVS